MPTIFERVQHAWNAFRNPRDMNEANVARGEEFIRLIRANSRAMYAASYAGG